MLDDGSSHGSSIVRLPLARWMTVGMQSQPRLAASDTLEKAPLGADFSDLQSLPHRIPSFSGLIGFTVWTHVSITKEGLDEKELTRSPTIMLFR